MFSFSQRHLRLLVTMNLRPVKITDQFIYATWWRHQMETFSALLAICAGNSPVPGEFPAQSQWRGALMFSLICVWINGWVYNREAGDLRRYRVHYDVIVMMLSSVKMLHNYTCWLGTFSPTRKLNIPNDSNQPQTLRMLYDWFSNSYWVRKPPLKHWHWTS